MVSNTYGNRKEPRTTRAQAGSIVSATSKPIMGRKTLQALNSHRTQHHEALRMQKQSKSHGINVYMDSKQSVYMESVTSNPSFQLQQP